MKERPILFSGAMVRAILAGNKTQSRRIVKPSPSPDIECFQQNEMLPQIWHGMFRHTDGKLYRKSWDDKCPYGKPGDQLWVREVFRVYDSSKECACYDECRCAKYHGSPIYRATDELAVGPWRPSIHMPRKFSRITLEITGIRVERLQAIGPADCDAEGIERTTAHTRDGAGCLARIDDYRALWESINGPGSWAANPWVWVIGFRKAEA